MKYCLVATYKINETKRVESDLSNQNFDYYLTKIKEDSFKNSNQKFKHLYTLTPKDIEQKIIITKQYIAKKLQEYEKLKKYI